MGHFGKLERAPHFLAPSKIETRVVNGKDGRRKYRYRTAAGDF